MTNLTSSKLKSSALQKKMKGNENERQTKSNHSAYIWHNNLYPKHIKNSYNSINNQICKQKNGQNICTAISQKQR